MKSNRVYLIILLAIAIAFVPAILLRDLAPYTELNYLSTAKSALEQGHFWSIFDGTKPYVEKPPLYIWIAMAALSISAEYSMAIMLAVSVASFIYIIIALDRAFGYEFRHQERLLIIIGMGSLIALDFTAVRASLDMLFVALITAAFLRIFKRYRLIVKERQEAFLHATVHPPYANADPIEALAQDDKNLNDDEAMKAAIDSSYKRTTLHAVSSMMESTLAVKAMRHHVKYGNLSIPFLGFLGFLLNGLGAFVPLVATVFLLAYERDLKSFFKLIRPHYFIIVALLTAIWGAITYNNNPLYFKAIIEEMLTFGFKHDSMMSLQPVMPIYMVWILITMLVVPVGISGFYFMISSFVRKIHLSLNQIGALSLSVAVLFIFVLMTVCELIFYPNSGLYAIVSANRIVPMIVSLPTIFYFVVLSYKRSQEVYEENERALNKDGSELGVFVRRFREQQRKDALNGKSDIYRPQDINPPHRGLEIVGDGYFLGAISLRADRPRLPWLLVASYIVMPFAFIALFTNFFIFSKTFPELNEPQVGTALGVLALFGIVSIVMLLSRLFLFSLAANGIGMLGMVFCLGLASPQLNSYIGFERLAFQSSQSINRGGSPILCIVGFPNGDSIKIFDHRFRVYTDQRVIDRCIDNSANVIVASHVLKNDPSLAIKIRSAGGYLIGDRLFLPSVPQDHIEKYAENPQLSESIILPKALVLNKESERSAVSAHDAHAAEVAANDLASDAPNADEIADAAAAAFESLDATDVSGVKTDINSGAARDSIRNRQVHFGTGENISGKYARIVEERRNHPRIRRSESTSTDTSVVIPADKIKVVSPDAPETAAATAAAGAAAALAATKAALEQQEQQDQQELQEQQEHDKARADTVSSDGKNNTKEHASAVSIDEEKDKDTAKVESTSSNTTEAKANNRSVVDKSDNAATKSEALNKSVSSTEVTERLRSRMNEAALEPLLSEIEDIIHNDFYERHEDHERHAELERLSKFMHI